MREILDLCVKMDVFADRLYEVLSRDCPEPELAALFARMAEDEAQHTDWWQGLLDAWEHGLLPDLVNDTTGLTQRLTEVYAELETIDLDSVGTLDIEQMLALAARVEFFMIDPVFGELIDLTEPAQAGRRHAIYQVHVQRLVTEISRRFPTDSLAAVLATSLTRAWTDTMRLSAYATHDSLTRLHNRRAPHTHLPQWAAWSARYGHPLTVLLVDVDRLKSVNDQYGHAMGDVALQAVGAALREGVRGSDFVVRYGGDEFAVIAPETAEPECVELCARLLESVQSIAITAPNGDALCCTVSIGSVVSHDVAGSEPRSVESLLAAADRSLYAAKQAGRNRAGASVMFENA
ncbi:MAG: diguanylate cyclase [Coriobacteriia bacterium]